jgi:hypothetical protein
MAAPQRERSSLEIWQFGWPGRIRRKHAAAGADLVGKDSSVCGSFGREKTDAPQERKHMPGRGPQSFKKRQKEQQRKEKQQEKMAKRLERKRQGSAAGSDAAADRVHLTN